MDGYTTLHEMLEVALKQAGEESGMLLGQELSIALTDSLKTTKTAYFGDLDDANSDVSRILKKRKYKRLILEAGTDPELYFLI